VRRVAAMDTFCAYQPTGGRDPAASDHIAAAVKQTLDTSRLLRLFREETFRPHLRN